MITTLNGDATIKHEQNLRKQKQSFLHHLLFEAQGKRKIRNQLGRGKTFLMQTLTRCEWARILINPSCPFDYKNSTKNKKKKKQDLPPLY